MRVSRTNNQLQRVYSAGTTFTVASPIAMSNKLAQHLKPSGMLGIRHVALFVKELETAVDFYHDIIGMKIEWQPDEDNVYLTNGGDVLALHRIDDMPDGLQRLDHIGFVLENIEDVDHWYNYLMANKVLVTEAPKTHRDGARGFYCLDPVGNFLEFIFHPPISRIKNAPKISD